jgi:hypothetical protein
MVNIPFMIGRLTEPENPDSQPIRSDTGIMQTAAFSGQVHPSAKTNATSAAVQMIRAM